MEDKQQARLGFVPSVLPWFIASGAFLIYLATLNHWVTLNSLPYVAKVTGWDWSLPLQAPLFYLLTYPIRWLPSGWQPVSLNVFAAGCSALTLALLARSVALLPHDRTLAQRQRERSEFSFLTIPSAWLPPVFAALVCGLQLTFWKHSTAATNESLDLLLFAYVIRCLLEFRVEQRESWLVRLALVYGMGVTNNWALIGFFPGFLIALIWIKGTSFFNAGFILRMLGYGLAGLLLYLLLPLFWALSDGTNVGFWQALRAELGNQKGFLFNTQLRSHALVLLLASILPILIMGIRWPSSFGDTSAAGAALTNLMFRVIHLVFLATCLWVFFYQQFNSRAVGFGVPFLTFYYLGALGVGYFSGYALLVFSEAKSTKNWNRRSAGGDLLDRLMVGLLWIAFIAVPVGLINKNWKTIREGNGPILTELAEHLAAQLPASGALVLSDDPSGLMLLQAQLNRSGSNNKHLLVHSRSLSVPEYHAQLAKRYPQRWPNIAIGVPDGEIVEDAALLLLMMGLGRTNDIYYLHPSFGFYFEHFYPQANGLVYRLTAYPTNQMIPPPLGSAEFAANQSYWTQREPTLKKLQTLVRYDSPDARYVAGYYSRALNSWGVALQRGQHLPEAGVDFKLATELNTNNRPALVNLDFNKVLRSGEARVHETFKSAEEKFGLYRSWEKILYENGPFDHPDICFLLGDILRQQSLYRQSAIEFDRIRRLEPTNVFAKLALANVYLEGHQLDRALETAAEIKAAGGAIGVENELELARLEAAAYFSRTNLDAAQKVLVAAHENHPDRLSALDALVMFYGKSKRFAEALENVDKMLKLDPGNAPALINQATLYFNQTNHTQALAALDRLLQKDPKNVQALLYKVFMHTETKDYPKATADVDRILEFEPDNQEALLYQGVIRIEAKEFEQAMKPLNRLLKLQPNNWKALRNRAIANLHRGKLDEAKADYETLRKNLPRYYIAYYGLAEIAYRLKDAPNAIKYYELYLKYVPNLDSPEMADEKKMVNGRLSELKTGKR